MKRIYLTLAILAAISLCVAITLGLSIGDAKSEDLGVQQQVGNHMLIGMGVLTFATLVHAIGLTYFMGTGRWIEETSQAYSLDGSYHSENQRIKYKSLPLMTTCILLMVATGALGAVADPATPASLEGTLGMTDATIHLLVSVTTAVLNMLAFASQFVAISRNSVIVDTVLADVKRIREERGLPV